MKRTGEYIEKVWKDTPQVSQLLSMELKGDGREGFQSVCVCHHKKKIFTLHTFVYDF